MLLGGERVPPQALSVCKIHDPTGCQFDAKLVTEGLKGPILACSVTAIAKT
jgi:hypothetical protein